MYFPPNLAGNIFSLTDRKSGTLLLVTLLSYCQCLADTVRQVSTWELTWSPEVGPDITWVPEAK